MKKTRTATSKAKPARSRTNDRESDRYAKILQRLDRTYPNVKCALNFASVFQLLVATILSAQCTDKRVNMVTSALFSRFPTAADMARASITDIERLIRSTGFYHNKAKNIMGTSVMLVEKFSGKVPRTMEELLLLPGVARKTANVVLGVGYGIEAGVCVDTHVGRLSRRLGLSSHESPVKVEQDLMNIIPQQKWDRFSLQLIQHGREICFSQKPRCDACVLADICPSAFLFPHFKTNRKKVL